MSAKGFWFAFGLGATVGATVALLYAPQTGMKTRRLVKKNYEEGVDSLQEATQYLKQQAEYLSKETQKTIKRTKGQAEDAYDKASNAVSGAVKSAQSLM